MSEVKVIKLKAAQRKIAVADDAMQMLRMAMYEWDATALAHQVGVSKSCIMAIRSGRTKWPRPATFFGLLDALDMEMVLRHKG
jgi:hypothetical protein